MSEQKQYEVLIVGAGNIGRVYGYHLFKAGVKIHYYVREHNKQNFTNYPLRIHRLTSVFRFCNKSETEKFSDYTITTDTDIANGNAPNLPEKLDYVIFAVPCHHLGEGNWLKTLIDFLNNKYQKNVYYTSPIPDETDMQRIVDMGVDKTQIISGQTNTSSYFAPLAKQRFEARGDATAKKDDEEDNPNKVIVCCPTIPEVFGELTPEAKPATDELVSLLNKGGLNTINIGKSTQYAIYGLLATPLFVAFAMYEWNLYDAGKDYQTMSLTVASLKECAKVLIKKTEDKVNSSIKLISLLPTFLFCFGLFLVHFVSCYICSFDIEAFCNAHFNVKLGDQTEYFTSIIKSDAEKYNIDLTNFNKLLEKYQTFLKKDE